MRPYVGRVRDDNPGTVVSGRAPWAPASGGVHRILPGVNFSAWLPIFAVGIVFSIAMLIHLARNEVPYMPKWAWALLIIAGIPLGALIYLLVVVLAAGAQRGDAEGRRP